MKLHLENIKRILRRAGKSQLNLQSEVAINRLAEEIMLLITPTKEEKK